MSDLTVTRARPGMITIRGDLAELAGPVARVAGCAMPERRLSTRAGGRTLLWMSPDEAMLICPRDEAAGLAADLAFATGDVFATVVDVSDARAVWDLTGPVEDVLSTLAPVDFAALEPSEVRRTRLAQVPAAFWCEGDGWRLVAFRSVAGYVEGLMRVAAA
jgi:sarcosine oxidase subunit gamma